jgi:hypothetical protein
MLGWEGSVNWNYSRGKLQIAVPDLNPANMPCAYAWVFQVQNVLDK